MSKIELSRNKVLKLTNAVVVEITEGLEENLELIVMKIENYIRSKGYTPIGPLIQYTDTNIDENGVADIVVKLIRQSSGFIHHVELPYKCISTMRISNCMYVRYTGPESMLRFAYDKIRITAFEEDIKLIGDSYTIFVNQIDDNIVADVFMEKANNE